jgi:hypothetical protein
MSSAGGCPRGFSRTWGSTNRKKGLVMDTQLAFSSARRMSLGAMRHLLVMVLAVLALAAGPAQGAMGAPAGNRGRHSRQRDPLRRHGLAVTPVTGSADWVREAFRQLMHSCCCGGAMLIGTPKCGQSSCLWLLSPEAIWVQAVLHTTIDAYAGVCMLWSVPNPQGTLHVQVARRQLSMRASHFMRARTPQAVTSTVHVTGSNP